MKSLDKDQKQPFFLSVVMPVYNEADVIEKVIVNFCDEVLSKFKEKEYILVDDCSTDGTTLILKRIQKKYPYIKIIKNPFNQGHGPSLIRAYHEAKGDYIFHCDSDNQFVAEDFWVLWERLRKNKLDLVMGYRKQRHDPAYRTVMSNSLRLFNFIIFGVLCHDMNAPFKLYTKSSLDRVLPIVPGDAFFPTILMTLSVYAYGMKISEIPVRHLPRLTGKSLFRNWKIIALCWKAGKEIIQFKKHLLKPSLH